MPLLVAVDLSFLGPIRLLVWVDAYFFLYIVFIDRHSYSFFWNPHMDWIVGINQISLGSWFLKLLYANDVFNQAEMNWKCWQGYSRPVYPSPVWDGPTQAANQLAVGLTHFAVTVVLSRWHWCRSWRCQPSARGFSQQSLNAQFASFVGYLGRFVLF